MRLSLPSSSICFGATQVLPQKLCHSLGNPARLRSGIGAASEPREARHRPQCAYIALCQAPAPGRKAERALAKDERLNYPQLADCEALWVNKLEAALKGRTPQDVEEYQAVFQTASQVFELLRDIPIPPNGYLGVLKVIRERFGFLQAEYGFRVEDEQPTGIKFCSDLPLGSNQETLRCLDSHSTKVQCEE